MRLMPGAWCAGAAAAECQAEHQPDHRQDERRGLRDGAREGGRSDVNRRAAAGQRLAGIVAEDQRGRRGRVDD